MCESLRTREAVTDPVSEHLFSRHTGTELSLLRGSDPLEYWKENATQFPSLAAVATRYLCAPCSSVDSERLFSAVANVLDENRNRLSADRVEMLIFIKKNIHVLKAEEKK